MRGGDQPQPYPVNCNPILPTATISCQPQPYLANRNPILSTATLSFSQALVDDLEGKCVEATDQLQTYFANCNPILPTATLFRQP